MTDESDLYLDDAELDGLATAIHEYTGWGEGRCRLVATKVVKLIDEGEDW